MRKVVYRMGVSLDGFIAAPGDDIGWTAPDAEVFKFHIDAMPATGVELYGRKLYEVMRYWETAGEQNPDLPEDELEWERLWKATPKVVVSRTLERVGPAYELVRAADLAERVASLKAEPGGQITVGGAGLAASLLELGLVDELQPLVYPVVVGGGTPYLPALETPLDLQLLETRSFGSGVVFLRYAIA